MERDANVIVASPFSFRSHFPCFSPLLPPSDWKRGLGGGDGGPAARRDDVLGRCGDADGVQRVRGA